MNVIGLACGPIAHLVAQRLCNALEGDHYGAFNGAAHAAHPPAVYLYPVGLFAVIVLLLVVFLLVVLFIVAGAAYIEHLALGLECAAGVTKKYPYELRRDVGRAGYHLGLGAEVCGGGGTRHAVHGVHGVYAAVHRDIAGVGAIFDVVGIVSGLIGYLVAQRLAYGLHRHHERSFIHNRHCAGRLAVHDYLILADYRKRGGRGEQHKPQQYYSNYPFHFLFYSFLVCISVFPALTAPFCHIYNRRREYVAAWRKNYFCAVDAPFIISITASALSGSSEYRAKLKPLSVHTAAV